jgi:hypothetical protein
MIHGLLNIDYSKPFCEECVLSKQVRNLFSKRTEYRAKNILELMTTQERQIYFLKEKSEALKIFKKFKVMVEKRTCYYIKSLQSDRYGEYLLTAFTNFCKEEGIKRFLMAPY